MHMSIAMHGGGANFDTPIKMGEPNLSVLTEELKSLADKWETLATCAQLPQETVQSLKDGGGEDEERLREVLRHWMEGLGEGDERVTWAAILDVIRDLDAKLAGDLESKFVVASTTAGEEVEMASEGSEEVRSKGDDASEEKMDDSSNALVEEVEEGKKEGETAAISPGNDSSAHVYSQSWSKLEKEEIVNRIKGMIYGQAIGDALGEASHMHYTAAGLTPPTLSCRTGHRVHDEERSTWLLQGWCEGLSGHCPRLPSLKVRI